MSLSFTPCRQIILVFVAAVLVTALFQTALPEAFQSNDSDDYVSYYEPVARGLLSGNGLTRPDGTLATRYPPGYPILLAGVFGVAAWADVPERLAILAFSWLNMGLASVLVFVISRSVWGPRLGMLAAAIWMTYPFTLWLTKQPNSELPFVVALYAGFLLCLRACLHRSRAWMWCALAGLVIGFAMLIRPAGLAAFLPLAALLWLSHRGATIGRRALLIAMLVLGSAAAVLPWEAWAYENTGEVLLLSKGDAPSVRDGLTFGARSKGYRQDFKLSEDVVTLMRDADSKLGPTGSLLEIFGFVGEQLRTRPLVVMELFGLKALRSWYGTDSGRLDSIIALIQIPYLFLIVSGALAAWSLGGFKRELAVGVWLLLTFFLGASVMVLSILRYMVPAIGLAFVLVPAVFAFLESLPARRAAKVMRGV